MSEGYFNKYKKEIKEYKTKIIVYRMIYLWLMIIFPLFGYAYEFLRPQFRYMILFRVLTLVAATSLFGLSFNRSFASKYLEVTTMILMYFFSGWMLLLNITNSFEISLCFVYLIAIILISNLFFNSVQLHYYIATVSITASIAVTISNNIYWYKLFVIALFTVIPGTVFFIANEKIKVENKNIYLAYNDTLTQLPNRRMTHEVFRLFSQEAVKTNNMVGVIFINFDNFKYINNFLGYEVGDLMLVKISNRLRRCIRKEDFIGRVGGDEFVILFPNIQSQKMLSPIIKRILKDFYEPFEMGGKKLHVTYSAGISLFPKYGKDFETLLKYANIAMYQAKESGGNKFRYFSEELHENFIRRLEMKEELISAIARREFVLHYQPKVNIKTGEITGSEVLIRWQHPERGLLYPDKFIEIAEQYNLIKSIDKLVLELACNQIKEWNNKGLEAKSVAINISASQFNDNEFIDIIDSVIKDTGIEPSLVNLEITETVAMRNVEYAKEILNKMKNRGVTVSLDDFGTKYSSLNYLKSFPIDVLKIDKSFIDDIEDNEVEKTILLSIINIAKVLNIKVVAEGVETREQLKILSDYNCEECQGYVFSKPVTVDKLEELMEKKHKYKV